LNQVSFSHNETFRGYHSYHYIATRSPTPTSTAASMLDDLHFYDINKLTPAGEQKLRVNKRAIMSETEDLCDEFRWNDG